jgi:hypothetical protein
MNHPRVGETLPVPRNRRDADRRVRIAPALAFVADLAVVAVFVLLGRRTHHEDAGLAGFLRVAWPFAVGLLVGWAVSGLRHAPLERRRVVVTWVSTVAAGALLRVVVQDRTAKPTFLLVASLFVGAGLFGWRAAVDLWFKKHIARADTRASKE